LAIKNKTPMKSGSPEALYLATDKCGDVVGAGAAGQQAVVANATEAGRQATVKLYQGPQKATLGSFLEFLLYQRLEPKIRELSNGHYL
jgi:hypothetical protein